LALDPLFFLFFSISGDIARAKGMAQIARETGLGRESRAVRKYLIEQLIARGFKRNEIADWLGVSVKTVYTTTYRFLLKDKIGRREGAHHVRDH